MDIKTIGILGTGKMGSAIILGLSKKSNQWQLSAYDIVEDPALKKICKYVAKPQDLDSCDVVMICIKPQDIQKIKGVLSGKSHYISIAAGVSIQSLVQLIPNSKPESFARVMPNIAASIHQSASGIYSPNPQLAELVSQLFRSIGKTWILDKEENLHIVTALCGSAPAFVFAFLHALAEGGVSEGLSYQMALEMAIQTLSGAAQVLKEEGWHPSQARSKVTSPAGTTIAGLFALESGSLHATVMKALQSASERSKQLSADS